MYAKVVKTGKRGDKGQNPGGFYFFRNFTF